MTAARKPRQAAQKRPQEPPKGPQWAFGPPETAQAARIEGGEHVV